jgi:hypothetical protein
VWAAVKSSGKNHLNKFFQLLHGSKVHHNIYMGADSNCAKRYVLAHALKFWTDITLLVPKGIKAAVALLEINSFKVGVIPVALAIWANPAVHPPAAICVRKCDCKI